MSKQEPMYMLVYREPYTELARIVNNEGFPFRCLAEKVKPLIEQHGLKEVSLAITQMLSFTGWYVMIRPEIRRLCLFIGPEPYRWDEHYRNADGTPRPRPPGRESPPVIPAPVDDPYLSEIVRLTVQDLIDRLQRARKSPMKFKPDIDALESELIRRGSEIPVQPKPEPKPEPARDEPPATEKPKKRRTKKEAPKETLAAIPEEPTPEPPKEEPQACQEEDEQEGGITLGPPGLALEASASHAEICNRRQLLVMLRDARAKLKQHGRRSFSGKEAKKEIQAAEEELRKRDLPIPEEGEETREWDRPKPEIGPLKGGTA